MSSGSRVSVDEGVEPEGSSSSLTSVKVHRLKGIKDGQYSNPVFKKLSVINGEINRMPREELVSKLGELKLDSRGVTDVLKKRLKTHYREKKLTKAHVPTPKKSLPEFLMVIDFEATCEENNDNYDHEIIEFPVILVSLQSKQVVDEFHSYCKPRINPQLSEFCVQLTGITQDKVDSAEEFPKVLKRMEDWMKSHDLGAKNKFAVLTDGPWDMSRFMYHQCRQNKITYPRWGGKWINLRKAYSNFYQCRRTKLNDMLENLGMTFEGHLHSGLDDSRNIARIAIRLAEDGCELKVNEYLHYDKNENAFKSKHISPDSPQGGTSEEELNQSMDGLHLTNDGAANETEEVDDLLEYYRIQKS
ncbi:3'-5' exoribonuclease 1-like isoform X2 [Mytilus californianus]|nr:3'-5' exoribonuclease 1-like isoform X2 [Mytilus californianus]